MGKKAKKAVSEKKRGKKRAGGKNGRSIMQTLLAAFLAPVAMMVVLGVVSYNKAASGIMTKYEESALSTVLAVADYSNLICDSISTKGLEMVTNSDVGDYYDKYYKSNNSNSVAALRNAKNIISNTRSTNKYVFSCSVIPENGESLSTLSGYMTKNPYEDFQATAEGVYFTENPTVRSGWLGYHSYLDDNMDCSPEQYAVAFYQKVTKNNSVVVMDIDMSVMLDALARMNFGDGSVRALITADGREIASVQGEEESAETYFLGNEFFEASRAGGESGSRNVRQNGKDYVYIYAPVGQTGMMICALIPKSILLEQVGSIKYITVILVILAATAAMAIGGVISTGISRTVKSMETGLSAVAEGDLSRKFSTGRKDEFKILVSALNSTIDSMRFLMRDMKRFGTQVNDLASNVSDKTASINVSVQDISRTMDEVALGMQGQAQNVESSNERMLSFSENINAVTDRTKGMTSTVDKAIEAVEQGKVIVEDLGEKSDTTVSLTKVLVDDIDKVQKSSEEIKSFVEVIKNIAEQTNLLSLNASIEAARAGDSGKGFAVVAEEIRKLADQSKESGDEISNIVENIGSTMNQTTESAKRAENMINDQAQALSETVNVFGRIRDCVGELVDGIRTVTEHLEQVSREEETVQNAIHDISAVSEQVMASTEVVTATLNEQVGVFEKLKDEVEVLREDAGELDRFIDRFEI
ncbi:MAG: methyl-accepting chemotaxis protein [Muribaculaceae bacterium]|nr:methyl-accepting chemotaxis protein [Roseburia sp.]MCM1430682.1 methyl-accepting chemotaxis protein [Muribaculaceae bacterium]MCM1491949.1 methyl-accepting chemotaxis protein [Muribaculaceae bacterium]